MWIFLTRIFYGFFCVPFIKSALFVLVFKSWTRCTEFFLFFLSPYFPQDFTPPHLPFYSPGEFPLRGQIQPRGEFVCARQRDWSLRTASFVGSESLEQKLAILKKNFFDESEQMIFVWLDYHRISLFYVLCYRILNLTNLEFFCFQFCVSAMSTIGFLLPCWLWENSRSKIKRANNVGQF